MRLSIVIISWNSAGVLPAAISSLSEVLSRPDVELIRVDNGSTDGSADIPGDTSALTIRLPENRGVAYARNRGIEKAKGDYILLLDDDTEANTAAIDAMLSHLDNYPDTGICAVALTDAQGNLQESFKPYPGIRSKASHVIASWIGRKQKTELPDKPIHPCYVIGACQMIRREVISQTGLLDENIFYGPEDADLCLRAAKHGWKTTFLPEASIIHHWRRITRRNLFSPISRAHIRGLLHLYRKHRRWFI